MTNRYGTFAHGGPFEFGDMATHGVIDSETGAEYVCYSAALATSLAERLNKSQDCRFNCRAKRLADYVAGYEQCQKNMSLPGIDTAQTMLRCFDAYIVKGE